MCAVEQKSNDTGYCKFQVNVAIIKEVVVQIISNVGHALDCKVMTDKCSKSAREITRIVFSFNRVLGIPTATLHPTDVRVDMQSIF